MKLNIINRYLIINFFTSTLLVLGLIFALIYFAEFMEFIKRVDLSKYSIFHVFRLSLLKTPSTLMEAFPFCVLLGGLLCLFKLSHHRELMMLHTTHLSLRQIVAPLIGAAILLSLFKLLILQTFSAYLYKTYYQDPEFGLADEQLAVEFSDNGLWLRQKEADGYTIIHIQALNDTEHAQTIMGKHVTIFHLNAAHNLAARIVAAQALLQDKYWVLQDVYQFTPLGEKTHFPTLTLPTQFNTTRLKESVTHRKMVYLWQFPKLIHTLESSGFEAKQHRVYFQNLLSEPLLYVVMVLIALCFTPAHPRFGKHYLQVLMALLSGFLFYTFAKIFASFSIGGKLPPIMAVWLPLLISLFIFTSLFLKREEQ